MTPIAIVCPLERLVERGVASGGPGCSIEDPPDATALPSLADATGCRYQLPWIEDRR
jgi:hypothetical protein